MRSVTKFSVLAAASAVVAGMALAPSASAETQWQRNHPRRAEVNHRLGNQNQRIDRKVADGQMSQRQANTLHRDDHQIRQEERDMGSQNDGHITKSEDRSLNQQENAASRDIHND